MEQPSGRATDFNNAMADLSLMEQSYGQKQTVIVNHSDAISGV
jgi:hypothetical protein